MTTTATKATAYNYACQIRDTLAEIADIANTYGNQITTDQLRDLANQHDENNEPNAATETRKSADLLELHGIADNNEGHTVWDRYIDDSLEVTETASRALGGEWETNTVRLLISYGGPNCWIVAGNFTGVKIECHWGSDNSTIYCSEFEELGEILVQMAEW